MKNIVKTVINEMGVYNLALATKDFVYYVNHNEIDTNGYVVMYNTNGKLISNNYFGYTAYMDDMEKIILHNGKYEFIDEELLEYAREYFEEE